jgi:hypothetical protein
MSNSHKTIDAINEQLENPSSRLEALDQLEELLANNSTAVLLGRTEDLFRNLRKCLTVEQSNQEVLLKSN